MTKYDDCMAKGWKLVLFDDGSGHARTVDTNMRVDDENFDISLHDQLFAPLFAPRSIEKRVFKAFQVWSIIDDETDSYAALVFYPDKTFGLYEDKSCPQMFDKELRFQTAIEIVDWFDENS